MSTQEGRKKCFAAHNTKTNTTYQKKGIIIREMPMRHFNFQLNSFHFFATACIVSICCSSFYRHYYMLWVCHKANSCVYIIQLNIVFIFFYIYFILLLFTHCRKQWTVSSVFFCCWFQAFDCCQTINPNMTCEFYFNSLPTLTTTSFTYSF
jgi:hypothetical protein